MVWVLVGVYCAISGTFWHKQSIVLAYLLLADAEEYDWPESDHSVEDQSRDDHDEDWAKSEAEIALTSFDVLAVVTA